MATIFTVHGTFASGPTHGDAWWQVDSPFAREIARLVEAEDGPVDIVPVVWSGDNSEVARRRAAVALADRMATEDRAGHRYVAIGHSHGGSVVLSALRAAGHRRLGLERLSRWITVGTPFLETERHRFLFSRLGVVGKAGYAAILTFVALVLAYGVTVNVGGAAAWVGLAALALLPFHLLMSWRLDRRRAAMGAVTGHDDAFGLPLRLATIAVVTATVGFILLEFYERPWLAGASAGFLLAYVVWLRWYLRRRRETAASPWSPRWIAYWHKSDEAVQGLASVSQARFELFHRNVAVGPLTSLSIIALPAAVLTLLSSPFLMQRLAAWLGTHDIDDRLVANGRLIGDGRDVAVNIGYLMVAPLQRIFDLMGGTPEGPMIGIAFMVIWPAIYLTLAFAFVGLIHLLARAVSAGLARALNVIGLNEARTSAFGSDVHGERVTVARAVPHAFGDRAALPDAVAAEIGAISDAALATSVPKLRAAIGQVATTGPHTGVGAGDPAGSIAGVLSWDELIHTAYFRSPLFVKLIAYAIASSPGFRPSAAFQADPDFDRVAQWHGEMTHPVLEAPAATG